MIRADKPSFESLRDDLLAAPPAVDVGERRIKWVDESRTLAFSRDTNGRLELFLVGPPLVANEPSVRERVVHDTWFGSLGENLPANRLWLPHGDHFDAVAATILIELLDNGYPTDITTAFRKTEPLIALVLRQSEAESAMLTGLAGELLALVALLNARGAPAPEGLVQAWQGWQRSSRDFQLGSVGVEVKTSTTQTSRHHIQGWYQVEPGIAANGSVETHFYILSLGIRWLPYDSRGHTIEGLVKQVLSALPEHTRESFLDSVGNYGGRKLAIDATGTAGQKALRRPFVPTYERLYDMSDERIRVPRSSDFADFEYLIADSVTFEIQLPDRVRGDRNPIQGLSTIVAKIVNISAR